VKPNDSIAEMLLELQALDRVPRMGYVLRGVSEPESVAEHTFHVALMVWAMAEQLPEVDTKRALELALLHDLAEVRTGDLPMTAGRYWPEGAKKVAEGAANRELLAPLGELADHLNREMAERTSVESRLVKACDKVQLLLKVSAYEHWGAGGLAEFWANEDNFPSSGFEPVDRLVAELRELRTRLHLD
jgi:putative hydrolase of HD superfamily